MAVSNVLQYGQYSIVNAPHISRCSLSLESCTFKVGPLRDESWSMVMYGGIDMDSSPRCSSAS